MMLCETATPQKSKMMQDWSTMFPKTDFTTIEGSTNFIKKLIAVSLSSITYMRGIFPDNLYGERKLGGLRIKILNENCGKKAVEDFVDLIRGCYDAVEKKYLQQLSVGVCLNPENRNEVVEAYKLEFRYKDDECSITRQNKTKVFLPKQSDPVVQASFLMLKNIYTVSEFLGPLPKCPYITLKLLYYDDITPPDYEPPGFEPSTDVKFNFASKCLNVGMGGVDTKHHGINFLLKSTIMKPSLPQPEDPLLTPVKSAGDDIKTKSTSNNGSQSLISSGKGSSQIRNFKCLCECKTANSINTITCGSCEVKQHKTCYGMTREEDLPAVFYCINCMVLNTDDNQTDMVYKYRGKELKEFCAMRRALMFCANQETVTRQALTESLGCIRSFSNILLDRLESEGFIKQTEEKGVFFVNSAHWDKAGWQNYFPVNANDQNEDQTYQDSLANHSPQEISVEIQEIKESCQNYNPEKGSQQHDTWKSKNHEAEDCTVSLTFGNPSYSPECDSAVMKDITNVESSISRVKKLSLSNNTPTETTTTRRSRKRKASNQGLPVDDSSELFQSQKKVRGLFQRKGKGIKN